MTTRLLVGVGLALLALHALHVQGGKYRWMGLDNFDRVDEQFRSVNYENCRQRSQDQMTFRDDIVTQIPKFNQLKSKTWYKNRTSLIHLHNMALNRAFYFSYILQKMNESQLFYIQPNWMYQYFSVAADVNANPYGINGSAIYFDTNCTYPNWYTTVNFNNTLPLYAPKAWRWDDYQDQDNLLREPTRRVVMVHDLGAGYGMNYTHPGFKMNPWYRKWLPDLAGDMDSLTKYTYYIGIKYSNVTGSFTTKEFLATHFFGPSSPGQQEQDERMLPVLFTRPYFDCGRANKWVLSATSPIVDYMPRYSNWTHLRRQRFVGVVVMDIDFEMIDFNACPVSIGNPGPSYLAGVSRCKRTTMCKFKPGYGFSRGGYTCWCRPGFRYPVFIDPPFQGDRLEQATQDEYDEGFVCSNVDHRLVLPKIDNLEGVVIEGGSNTLEGGGVVEGGGGIVEGGGESKLVSSYRSRTLKSFNETRETNPPRQLKARVSSPGQRREHKYSREENRGPRPDRAPFPARLRNHRVKFVARNKWKQKMKRLLANESPETRQRRKSRQKRSARFSEKAFDRMLRIFRQKDAVKADNCASLPPSSLLMAGDVAYGVEEQFEPEGRTALRLAHFLSMFLQNTDPDEHFGNLRGGGRLHIEHIFGEVIANVMGNYRILSSGVYWDSNQFVKQDGSIKELFGPLAYRRQGTTYAIDTAGLPHPYVQEEWYLRAKHRWLTNFQALKTYKLRMNIRADPAGKGQIPFEHFPMTYKAPVYGDGDWLRPVFRCDGRVDNWVMTYIVPFFGLDTFKVKLKFKGVVTVDVPLLLLHINQCPAPFHTANAFKNTARCDQFSSRCRPMEGFPFMRGSYRCDCKTGFEYPHLDGKFWYEGSLLELEYEKKVRGFFNRFDLLRCRVDSGAATTYNLMLIISSLIVCFIARLHKS